MVLSRGIHNSYPPLGKTLFRASYIYQRQRAAHVREIEHW